jgi:DNA-binding transcriptional regulator YhcF (GntR family)
MSSAPDEPRDSHAPPASAASSVRSHELDIERDSDVPISTQIYWQLAYQIESGRLQPGTRLPPVRELGATMRVNPNTIRSVYRRLAEAGYVVGRHGAGTRVVDRPPVRRGSDALAGIVAETLRRAAQLGFSPDEVAQATFTAATARRRPGPLVHVLFAECTTADATYDAQQIVEAFPERVAVAGVLLEDLTDRLDRYHYDLVATTTFHADEAHALVAGRLPMVAMLAGPGYVELVQEVASLPAGSKVGLVCGSERGVANVAEVLESSGATGVELIPAVAHTTTELERVDRDADLVLLSREATALGLESRFSRPERLREWSYELDPAGLELLRRAVERIESVRSVDAETLALDPDSTVED